MFTGIVEAAVPMGRFETRGEGARMILPAPNPLWAVDRGESVSVAGCCLTVAELLDAAEDRPVPGGTPGARMAFDLSSETLDKTWFGGKEPGRLYNLERALRLGDRLGGHLVAGHVDGGGTVVSIEDVGDDGQLIGFEVEPGLERYLLEKGSVTLDGISLTICDLRERRFGVAVIPVTLELTNLGAAEVGQRVNVEGDMVGKWIERLFPGAEWDPSQVGPGVG